MNTGNPNIDPIKQQLQEKFQDFVFDTDLDVSFILDNSYVAPVPATGTLKYWIGGAGAVSIALVGILLINNKKEENTIITPSKSIDSTINNPHNSGINSEDNNIEKITPEVKSSERIFTNKTLPIISKKSKNTDLDNTEKKVINLIEAEKNIESTVENSHVEEPAKNLNFEEFIMEKSAKKSDSLQLFIKKK